MVEVNDNEREKRNAHGREDMAKLKEKTAGKPQDCPKDLAEHLEVLIRTCLELLCNYKEENLGFEQKLNFTGTSSLPDCSKNHLSMKISPKAGTPRVHQATFPWEFTQNTPELTQGIFGGKGEKAEFTNSS